MVENHPTRDSPNAEIRSIPAPAGTGSPHHRQSIEEDIVLGRRQPRSGLVEQDLCDLFQTIAATSGWPCSSSKRRAWWSASRIAARWFAD